MQRRIFNLLQRKALLSESEEAILIDNIERVFFKTLLTPFNIRKLLSILEPVEFTYGEIIFLETNRITRHYFLLEGKVSFFKGDPQGQAELTQVKMGPDVLGDMFCPDNQHRTFFARNSGEQEEVCYGFWAPFEQFYRICSKQISQHSAMKYFLCDFIGGTRNILDKVNIYRHVGYKKWTYGNQVSLSGVLGIIVQGECHISKSGKNKNLEQHPCQVFKLCRMGCINLEQYFQDSNGNQSQKEQEACKYTVVTDSLLVISVPIDHMKELPLEMHSRLEFLWSCRKFQFSRVKSKEGDNIKLPKFQNKENAPFYGPKSPRAKPSLLNHSVGKMSKEEIVSVCRHFCIGYDVSHIPVREPRSRKTVGPPENIFRLSAKRERRFLRKSPSPEKPFATKDWSCYIKDVNRVKQAEQYTICDKSANPNTFKIQRQEIKLFPVIANKGILRRKEQSCLEGVFATEINRKGATEPIQYRN